MTTVEDSQAEMAFKAYEQGRELALLAFIAGRTVIDEDFVSRWATKLVAVLQPAG